MSAILPHIVAALGTSDKFWVCWEVSLLVGSS